MKALAAIALLALSSATACAAEGTGKPPTIAEALQQAQQQHKPLLIDFHAAWCYSCYYMARHVLTGKEWQGVEQLVVVVQADADSPDGHEWMDRLKIRALPSYVVLDDQGQELGRILAEQPRQKFYPELTAILAHGDTLDGLKQKAQAGSLGAVAEVLDAYQARGEGREGLAWFDTLPPMVRGLSAKDKHVVLGQQRLALLVAQQDKNRARMVELAQAVLAGPIGCDRSYVLDDLLDASADQPATSRRTLLSAQQAPMQQFLTSQVFSHPAVCADQRSAVLASADLDAALGDTKAEQALLDQAITQTRQALGGKLGSDRNLADNLRVYLARAKRADELDTLQQQLIKAYPDDYVYAYRYGRSLLEAGKPAQALPYLQQAEGKAYGINRLTVAALEVKALQALDRPQDARKVVEQALAANGPWFPKQAAALKASVQSS